MTEKYKPIFNNVRDGSKRDLCNKMGEIKQLWWEVNHELLAMLNADQITGGEYIIHSLTHCCLVEDVHPLTMLAIKADTGHKKHAEYRVLHRMLRKRYEDAKQFVEDRKSGATQKPIIKKESN